MTMITREEGRETRGDPGEIKIEIAIDCEKRINDRNEKDKVIDNNAYYGKKSTAKGE
jgi:hypothetical protein